MICHNKIYVHEISFDAGSNYTEVQLAKFVKFLWKRNIKKKYYQITSSKWKIIRSHAAGVYDILKDYIDDPDSVLAQIKVRTWLMEFDGVTPKRVYFEGLVKLSDIDVDADGEAIELSPNADDLYLWYESFKSVKYNPQTILTINTEVTYEGTGTKRVMFNDAIKPNGFALCAVTLDDWQDGRNYIITDYAYDDGSAVGSETNTWGWCKNNAGKYYRCKSVHTAAPGNEPPIGGNAEWDEVTPPPDSYTQYISEVPFDDYSDGNGIYDTDYPVVSATVSGSTNCDDGDFYLEGCSSATEVQTVATHARKLIDFSGSDGILNKMLTEAGQTLTLVSKFFSEATNPASEIANKLLNLIICTNDAIIYGDNTSDENDGLSLENIFTIFREAFNCYWYISGTDLIIEHLRFFENGYTYAAGSAAVGVNLTLGTYPAKINNTKDPYENNNLNKYSYGSIKFPEREVFKFATTLGTDGYLEYTSKIVEVGKEDEHNAQIVSTDIEMVVKFPTQVEDNGWALMACDPSNVIWRRDSYKDGYTPDGTVGDLYTDVVNGELYWDNLITDWWRYGCALTNIKINGTPSTALSLERGKKQEKVKFQRKSDIDETELIETHMGEGEIAQMEVDTESDWITVSLLYPTVTP